MFKLLNIELMKIFKHRSVYIVFVFVFIFCLLNNVIYKKDYNEEGFYKYSKENNLKKYIEKLEIINGKYDINKESDKTAYITNKTKIDITKLKLEYSKDDWRYIKANDYFYDVIYGYYFYKYVSNDVYKLKNIDNEYNLFLNKFKNNDWLFFLKKEKDKVVNKINSVNKEMFDIKDTQKRIELKKELKELKFDLVVLNYRIDKKINYSNTYLNTALIKYRNSVLSENKCKSVKMLSYDSKIKCYNELSNLYINKYMIDKKVNVNKVNTLNYQLRTIVDDYELFVVLIIIITSSILIGEEFNKGTIKQLLIKPYKRSKILFAKLIACFVMFIFTVFIIFLAHLLIGGLLLGFDSLKNGVVVYDFNINKVLKINIFYYMFLRIIVKLPMFLIIIFISFILGIILNSVIGAFSIVMLIYSFSEMINRLAITYNLKFMKYFITLNWNYRQYLFGGLSEYKYLDLKKSILIFVIYGIILMGIMLISFNKKNIKNI